MRRAPDQKESRLNEVWNQLRHCSDCSQGIQGARSTVQITADAFKNIPVEAAENESNLPKQLQAPQVDLSRQDQEAVPGCREGAAVQVDRV